MNVAIQMQSYGPRGDPQVSVGASKAIHGNELIKISASRSSVWAERFYFHALSRWLYVADGTMSSVSSDNKSSQSLFCQVQRRHFFIVGERDRNFLVGGCVCVGGCRRVLTSVCVLIDAAVSFSKSWTGV